MTKEAGGDEEEEALEIMKKQEGRDGNGWPLIWGEVGDGNGSQGSMGEACMHSCL